MSKAPSSAAKGKEVQRTGTPISTPPAAAPQKSASPVPNPVKKDIPEKSPEPASTEEGNPYIELLSKKMKTIKKRLAKIEKNEELKTKGQALDADQLRSLSQKQELLDSVRELEELQKQMEEVEAEEEKKLKKLQKKQATDELKRAQVLKDQHHEDTRVLLQYLSVLNLFGMDVVREHFVTGRVEGFSFSEHDLHTVDVLVAELYGHFDPSVGLLDTSKILHQKISKLFTKSAEFLPNGRSYAQAMDLLTNIANSSYFNPALAQRLREEREAAEAAAEAARIADEIMQKSYEFVHHDEIPAFSHLSLEQINGLPGPQVAFINESEVFGGQPNVAIDGSPSVFVPIPHTLYESLGAPTFSFRGPQHTVPSAQSLPQSAPAQNQQIVAEQISAEQLLLNGNTQNDRGGHRGGRGGSRRGGNSPRNFQDNNRSFDRTNEGTYHKNYERNHDRNYERTPGQARTNSYDGQQAPRRGGGAPQQSGPRGRGGAPRGSSRGGRQEGSSSN